jgi:hypothetical protein
MAHLAFCGDHCIDTGHNNKCRLPPTTATIYPDESSSLFELGGKTRDYLSHPSPRGTLDGWFGAKLATRGRYRDPALRRGLFEACALLSTNAATPLSSWRIGTISRNWLSRSCCNLCVFAAIFEACLEIRSFNPEVCSLLSHRTLHHQNQQHEHKCRYSKYPKTIEISKRRCLLLTQVLQSTSAHARMDH